LSGTADAPIGKQSADAVPLKANLNGQFQCRLDDISEEED